jgi:hypothetical protein
MHPLPLWANVFIFDDAGIKLEIEEIADTHRIWTDTPPLQEYVPCRLRDDPVNLELFLDRYERSRVTSPFNKRLYLRYRDTERPVVYSGNVSYRHTADGGVSTRVLSREELCEALRDEVGVSAGLIERWTKCGGLDLNFAHSEERPLPAVADVRPSLRIGSNV